MSTADGEVQRYFREVVLAYDGDDCLMWPFALSTKGYARMFYDGRNSTVSRLVCEHVNGPAPTPTHQAAHSCGNGKYGCVTKKHLSWKTPKGNSEDAIAHGTTNRGERHPRASLTSEQVMAIRRRAVNERNIDLAKEFGVNPNNISRIIHRVNWKHL